MIANVFRRKVFLMTYTTPIVSAATRVGPGTSEGRINQDAHYWLIEDDVIVTAVADGAGSLALSHLGASIAAQTACTEAIDAIQDGCSYEEALSTAFTKAREALLERDDWKQLGCTLAVTIVGTDGWCAGSVGDAFAVIIDHSGNITQVQAPRESEYANITKLLTSKDFHPTIECHETIPEAFAVSSDGLLRLSTEASGRPSSRFWLPLFSKVYEDDAAASKFLQWLDSKEHLDDDTTLLMVALQEES